MRFGFWLAQTEALGPMMNSYYHGKETQVKVVWGMYQDQQGLPRQFYKEQCKEGKEEADKRSVGIIISLSGQG